MKILQSNKFDGKVGNLVLTSNNTIRIEYDNTTISEYNSMMWNNIKDEEWAQVGLLKIVVEHYLNEQKAIKELARAAEKYFN